MTYCLTRRSEEYNAMVVGIIFNVDITARLAAHEGFCKKLDSFSLDMDAISLGTQDKMLLEILDYLNEWLQIHILDCDRKIARFMNGEQIED